MNKDHEPFIHTASGRKFYFNRPPEGDNIVIGDIAHALSNVTRFTGHTSRPYSVAQHSILVANMLSDWATGLGPRTKARYGVLGLLHDASEAYLSDIARPFKSKLDNYKEVEQNVTDRIFYALDIDPMTEIEKKKVKEYDNIALLLEADYMMNTNNWDGWEINPHSLGRSRWGDLKETYGGYKINTVYMHESKGKFLERYDEYTARLS